MQLKNGCVLFIQKVVDSIENRRYKIMGKDRSMAIKHAKAKKEAMKEVMNNQNDFAQTSWGLTDNMRKWFKAKPYALTYGK